MPRSSSDSLTPAEWKIMRIVWERKRCAARDVYEQGQREHGWAPSTSKTLLRRLTEKGYLKTQRVGNSFLYRPARPMLRSLFQAADSLLENTANGSTGSLLAYMVKKSDLSTEELAELRALLDQQAPE